MVTVAVVVGLTVGVVLLLTLASGGYDGSVVAGGLSLALFVAIMVWFALGLRGFGYRSPHVLYDAEFHAIQTDQQLMEPGPLRPQRQPREMHYAMGGIVGVLLVLVFVLAGT